MEGQLPGGGGSLLATSVEQLVGLPADTVLLPTARHVEPAGGAVLSRQQEPAAAEQLHAVELIDLSKAHLSGLLPTLAADCPRSAAAAGPALAGWGRVSLQDEYPRWQAVRQRLNLTEDHQLARVLLDLYETSVTSAQMVKMEQYSSTETVLHCEISDTTAHRVVSGGGGDGAGGDTNQSATGRVSCADSVRQQTATVARGRPGRRRPDLPHYRPCPRSRKPPGWYQEPAEVPRAGGWQREDDSSSEDVLEPAGAAEDGGEQTSKLFTFPPVEPELLHYFRCNLCDQADFGDVETYFDHLWNVHTEFHMVGDRIRRIPIRLRPQLFVICALCGLNNKGSSGFSDTYLTTTHMALHAAVLAAPPAPLRCDVCPFECADRGSLALHALDADHENAAHRCGLCGAEMEGTENYIAHLRAHYLARPFQCYFCMEMFRTEAGCIAHIKKHHVGDYSVHKCSGCGYATALFHDFLLHIRSHSQLNRHVCHICGVMFVSKVSLKHHIPTHSDSQFPCEKCGKVFTHPQTRRRHEINFHNRPDKCTCTVCGRQFGSAYSMKRHYMIHTGERPFQCDKCGRGFVQKGDLQSHYKRCKFTEISASVFV